MNQPAAEHLDILKELINIGVGRAAGALSEMVNCKVGLQVPFIKLFTPQQLRQEMEEFARSRISVVKLGFVGPFSGTAALVFPFEGASKLVAVLTEEEPGTHDLDSVRVETLSEVGNIVVNGVMGSIGNVLNKRIVYSLPQYAEDSVNNLLLSESMTDGTAILLARTHFIIQQLRIEGDIILLFSAGSFDALLSAIDVVH